MIFCFGDGQAYIRDTSKHPTKWFVKVSIFYYGCWVYVMRHSENDVLLWQREYTVFFFKPFLKKLFSLCK